MTADSGASLRDGRRAEGGLTDNEIIFADEKDQSTNRIGPA